MSRQKKKYPEDFKSLAGFFFTPFTATMGTMAASYYGLFLTDYAGIDSALGKTGFAAAFATIFIILTRIVDAVDDPLQSWIVDSAKERKFGKYRFFGIIGIILITVGTVMMFAIPGFVKGNAVTLTIWVAIGYLVLESGSAFGLVATPIMQKATTEPTVRSKIAAVMRMGSVIAAIPFLFYVPLITIIGSGTGNLGQAATSITVMFCLVFCGVSFLGIMLLKEPYRENVNKKFHKVISFKEIGTLIKTDVPLWVHTIALFIGGLGGGLSGGVLLHYVKWEFCANLTTGEVDLVKFAALSSVASIITLIPNFLCPFILTPLLKLFKTPDRLMRSCYLIMECAFLSIFVGNGLGLLSPPLLFVIYFIAMVPSGVAAMMMVLLTVECADYAEYKLGRNMTVMVNSIYNIMQKGSSIVGSAIPGFMFAIIGYSVNEATGAYAGELSNLPNMLRGMNVLMGPLPAVFGIVAFLIYKFFYKITPEYRKKMAEELARRHAEQGEGADGAAEAN